MHPKAQKAILVLWIGSVLLLALLFKWRFSQLPDISKTMISDQHRLSIDELLLTAEDLQTGTTTTLINIGLNQVLANAATNPITKRTPNQQHEVYNKILTQQIKKAKKQKTEDFTIKPIPK